MILLQVSDLAKSVYVSLSNKSDTGTIKNDPICYNNHEDTHLEISSLREQWENCYIDVDICELAF